MSGARRGTSSGSAMMAIAPQPLARELGKHSSPPASVRARTPTDAADHGIVPFLEIHARTAPQAAARARTCASPRVQLSRPAPGLGSQPIMPPSVRSCAGCRDAAVIEDVHSRPARTARRRCRLQVGEAEHQVGLQCHDAVGAGTGERGDPRLFARARGGRTVKPRYRRCANPRRADTASRSSPRSDTTIRCGNPEFAVMGTAPRREHCILRHVDAHPAFLDWCFFGPARCAPACSGESARAALTRMRWCVTCGAGRSTCAP